MNHNELFTIGIPTINRADLLNPTLEKYVKDFPNTYIFVIDNGNQEIFKHSNIQVFEQSTNRGVAGSWNDLCEAIFFPTGSAYHDLPEQIMHMLPYAWIMNDDIYSGKSEKEVIDWLLKKDKRNPLFIAPQGNWSNFILRREIFETVGPFDEQFYPAYYEDNDYHWRMKQKKSLYQQDAFLDPAIFRVSQSREKDPSLNAPIQGNLEKYVKKWGGPPGEERFRIPYDGGAQ
jgi:GT2 family glycosyltransferase